MNHELPFGVTNADLAQADADLAEELAASLFACDEPPKRKEAALQLLREARTTAAVICRPDIAYKIDEALRLLEEP